MRKFFLPTMRYLYFCIALVLLELIAGCVKHTTMRPPVSSSVGLPVLLALGEIDRKPLHLGIRFDQKLLGWKLQHREDLGTTEVPIGEVVAAKLVKALSYKFDRITLLTGSIEAPPLVLFVGLLPENPSLVVDIDSSMGIGAAAVEITAKIDVRIKGTLSDHGKMLWIGAPRVNKEYTAGGYAHRVFEGQTQASELSNKLSDAIVVAFLKEMQNSQRVRTYLEASMK